MRDDYPSKDTFLTTKRSCGLRTSLGSFATAVRLYYDPLVPLNPKATAILPGAFPMPAQR